MTRVLDTTQRLLRLIGCEYVNVTDLPRWYPIYRLFAFFWMSCMFVPFLTFLILIDNDLETIAQACTMITGETVVMLKTLLVHRHRNKLRHVLQTLQSDLDTSQTYNMRHFMWAHRTAHTIALLNNGSLLLAAITFILNPIGVIVVHLIRGTYSPQVLAWPSACLLPLDVHTLGGFVGGYAWEIMFNIYIMSTFMAMDGLFIGLCVYALAYLDDLVDRIRYLDADFASSKNAIALRSNLITVVKQHRHIYDWLQCVAALFSEMLLIQFGTGALLITNFVYQLQMSDGGNVAIFVLISCSLLGQTFMYCYASTRVTFKFLWTGDEVYNIQWYTFPLRLQPIVLSLLQQLQKLRYMSGMGIVKCSLESFKSLLNSIGTMIAVLQSLK